MNNFLYPLDFKRFKIFNLSKNYGSNSLYIIIELLLKIKLESIFDYDSLIFLKSFIGKFFAVSLCWTFSFHILNEIRHLIWDAGYGFDLKISKITGYATLILSFLLAIIIYFLGVSL